MDVADVAAAGFVCARGFGEARLEVIVVDVADGKVDEVAAFDGSISRDGDDGGAGSAGGADAGVVLVVERE